MTSGTVYDVIVVNLYRKVGEGEAQKVELMSTKNRFKDPLRPVS